MKNKDYAGQDKPKKAKSAPQPKRPFPLIRGTLTLALLAGFAYFLTSISGNSTHEQTAQDTPPNSESSNSSENTLPPPPDTEQWRFIEELKNKEVEVETGELADRGPFKMQCASFRNQDDANAMKATIAFAGYESDVRQSQGTNGVWYKVVLGPFEKKREAERTRRTLKSHGINGCQIWLWR